MKKIFIITCNPGKESKRTPYIDAYIEEVKKNGHEVRILNIYDLKIDYLNGLDDKSLYLNIKNKDSLTEELKEAQDNIVWADQIVLSYPVWWLGIPAKLKSFFERVFQVGIIIDYDKSGLVKILKNKTVVIIQSYNMPYFIMKYMCQDIPFKYLKIILSDWCGFKIEKRFDFDSIENISQSKKQKWLNEIQKFASKVK